jgi:hypothetical protein
MGCECIPTFRLLEPGPFPTVILGPRVTMVRLSAESTDAGSRGSVGHHCPSSIVASEGRSDPAHRTRT